MRAGQRCRLLTRQVAASTSFAGRLPHAAGNHCMLPQPNLLQSFHCSASTNCPLSPLPPFLHGLPASASLPAHPTHLPVNGTAAVGIDAHEELGHLRLAEVGSKEGAQLVVELLRVQLAAAILVCLLWLKRVWRVGWGGRGRLRRTRNVQACIVIMCYAVASTWQASRRKHICVCSK